MTVKELIKILEQYEPTADVLLEVIDAWGYYKDIEVGTNDDYMSGVVIIRGDMT